MITIPTITSKTIPSIVIPLDASTTSLTKKSAVADSLKPYLLGDLIRIILDYCPKSPFLNNPVESYQAEFPERNVFQFNGLDRRKPNSLETFSLSVISSIDSHPSFIFSFAVDSPSMNPIDTVYFGSNNSHGVRGDRAIFQFYGQSFATYAPNTKKRQSIGFETDLVRIEESAIAENDTLIVSCKDVSLGFIPFGGTFFRMADGRFVDQIHPRDATTFFTANLHNTKLWDFTRKDPVAELPFKSLSRAIFNRSKNRLLLIDHKTYETTAYRIADNNFMAVTSNTSLTIPKFQHYATSDDTLLYLPFDGRWRATEPYKATAVFIDMQSCEMIGTREIQLDPGELIGALALSDKTVIFATKKRIVKTIF